MGEHDYVSSGRLARELGYSLSGLRELIDRGTVPTPRRVAGRNRTWLVWPVEQVAEIERALATDDRRRAPAKERAMTPA